MRPTDVRAGSHEGRRRDEEPDRAVWRRDDRGGAGQLPVDSPGTAIPNTFPFLFER